MNLFNQNASPCIGKGCPDFGNIENDFDIISRPIVANLDGVRAWGKWTVSAKYTAYCPIGYTGNPVTLERSYTSQFGFVDALLGAIFAVTDAARRALVCVQPINPTLTPPQAQYTATITTTVTCPTGTVGDQAEGTYTAMSLLSQTDADTQAQNGAILAAQANLNCKSATTNVPGCVAAECTGALPNGGGRGPGGSGGMPIGGKGSGGQSPVTNEDGSGSSDTPTAQGVDNPGPTPSATPCTQPILGPIVPTLVNVGDTVSSLTLTATATSPTAYPQINFDKILGDGTNINNYSGERGVIYSTIPLNSANVTKHADGTYTYSGKDPMTGKLVNNIQLQVVGTTLGQIPGQSASWLDPEQTVLTQTKSGDNFITTKTITIVGAQANDVYSATAETSCGFSNLQTYKIDLSGNIQVAFIKPLDEAIWATGTNPLQVNVTPGAGVTISSVEVTIPTSSGSGLVYCNLVNTSGNLWEGTADTTGYNDLDVIPVVAHVTGEVGGGTVGATATSSVTLNAQTAPTAVLTPAGSGTPATYTYTDHVDLFIECTVYHLATITQVQLQFWNATTSAWVNFASPATQVDATHYRQTYTPTEHVDGQTIKLQAIATDSNGKTGTSLSVIYEESYTAPAPPKIVLSAPSTFNTPTVNITATVTAYNGASVSQVHFYLVVGGTETYLGFANVTAGVATYTYTPGTPFGTYQFDADCVDSNSLSSRDYTPAPNPALVSTTQLDTPPTLSFSLNSSFAGSTLAATWSAGAVSPATLANIKFYQTDSSYTHSPGGSGSPTLLTTVSLSGSSASGPTTLTPALIGSVIYLQAVITDSHGLTTTVNAQSTYVSLLSFGLSNTASGWNCTGSYGAYAGVAIDSYTNWVQGWGGGGTASFNGCAQQGYSLAFNLTSTQLALIPSSGINLKYQVGVSYTYAAAGTGSTVFQINGTVIDTMPLSSPGGYNAVSAIHTVVIPKANLVVGTNTILIPQYATPNFAQAIKVWVEFLGW